MTDIHPVAFEIHGMELTIAGHGRECLLFDGSGSEFDSGEDGGVEDVDTGIDTVADEFDGLLDEAFDSGGVVGLVNNDTIFAGLLDLGDHDGTLVSVGVVEGRELRERVVADDIRVEDKEGLVILCKNLLGQFQGAGSSQGFLLDGKGDLDVVLLLILLQSTSHDFRAVVDGENDICDAGSSQGLDLMLDHGSVGKLDEGLGFGEGERSKSGAEATDENEGCRWLA